MHKKQKNHTATSTSFTSNTDPTFSTSPTVPTVPREEIAADEVSDNTHEYTIETLLAPLLQLLHLQHCLSGDGCRLVVSSTEVLFDTTSGKTSVLVFNQQEGAQGDAQGEDQWGEEQFWEVVAALEEISAHGISCEPLLLADGVMLHLIGAAPQQRLVLLIPPVCKSLTVLCDAGRLSSLAAKMLSSALSLGRNILVLGPADGARELIGALLLEGKRPVWFGGDGDPVAADVPLLSRAEQILYYGADRIGAPSLALIDLLQLMGSCSGVVGWLDAHSEQRALMRVELAASSLLGDHPEGPAMQVLSSIDLLVRLRCEKQSTHHRSSTDSTEQRLRVTDIYEVLIGPEGYQSQPLFVDGVAPVPTVLTPVGVPSFIDLMRRAGEDLLVDELIHASAGFSPVSSASPPAAMMSTQVSSAPASAGLASTILASSVEQPASEMTKNVLGQSVGRSAVVPSQVPTAFQLDSVRDDAPPPGWELEQLNDDELLDEVVESNTSGSVDDAVMAASYGLAPPVAPPGARRSAATESSFQDALARAKSNDSDWHTKLGKISST